MTTPTTVTPIATLHITRDAAGNPVADLEVHTEIDTVEFADHLVQIAHTYLAEATCCAVHRALVAAQADLLHAAISTAHRAIDATIAAKTKMAVAQATEALRANGG